MISSGRKIGPVISGLLIASFGMAPSFFINAISFGLVVLVLVTLDVARLHATRPAERQPGQVREGLSYIRQDRVLRLTVIAMFVVFVGAYNLQVMVPLLSSRILGGSSELYGVAMSCLGLGAVTGSLLMASRVKPGVMMVALCCGLLSVVYIWLSFPVGVYFALAGVFLLGVSCSFFNVTVTSTLQLRARDDVRGRVMAMYSIGILDSALVGAPLVGTLADTVGVSHTFLVIAAVCASTAAATAWTWLKYKNRKVDSIVQPALRKSARRRATRNAADIDYAAGTEVKWTEERARPPASKAVRDRGSEQRPGSPARAPRANSRRSSGIRRRSVRR